MPASGIAAALVAASVVGLSTPPLHPQPPSAGGEADAPLTVAPRTGSVAPGPGPAPGGQQSAPADEPAGPKQRGVALGLFAEDIGFSYTPLLREIATLGATHVSLVVPLYQTDGRSADLGLHTRLSPTLELIADTVRAARREHLEVTVFPIVRLLHPRDGEWRGTLAPRDRTAWFNAYADVLGDIAAIAAQTGATRLAIGSELSSLDDDLGHWKPLVERIRAVFPGKLVYSANWDHYREAQLFDLVDEDGVVAHFPLRESGPARRSGAANDPAGDAALEAAWRRHKEALLAWHEGRDNPLILTELGYRSRAGSTLAPWDESARGASEVPDLDEQRRGFAAFRRAWSGERRLAGVYVWNWYGWGGPRSTGYTPRGKTAEAEVKRLLDDL